MASRKDLLKAQSFTTGRLVASFVDRDPDNATGPLRRVGTATFVGVLIGVIIIGIFALIGFLRPGTSNSWKQADRTLVSDVSSGLLFVYYRNQAGEEILLPMADVASARLAMGTSDIKVVKTDKLQGIAQDVMRGIPDAPRQLPPPTQMDPYPFRTCSGAPDADGQRYLTIEVGKQAETTPVTAADDVAVIVQADDGEHFLVIDGVFHHVYRPGNATRTSLPSDIPVLRTGNAWLSALPEGAPIAPFDIPNRDGTPVNRPGQTSLTIGTIVQVKENVVNPETTYYIQLADGLAKTSFLNMAVELAAYKPGTMEPPTISQADADRYVSPTTPLMVTPGIPMGRPKAPVSESPDQSVCATYVDPAANGDRQTPVITVGRQTPTLPQAVADRPPNRAYADFVDVDPLHGVLLQDSGIDPEQSAQGPTFLVSNGQIYGIPDARARESLGYGGVGNQATPVLRVPGMMIRLVGPIQVELSQSAITPALPEGFVTSG